MYTKDAATWFKTVPSLPFHQESQLMSDPCLLFHLINDTLTVSTRARRSHIFWSGDEENIHVLQISHPCCCHQRNQIQIPAFLRCITLLLHHAIPPDTKTLQFQQTVINAEKKSPPPRRLSSSNRRSRKKTPGRWSSDNKKQDITKKPGYLASNTIYLSTHAQGKTQVQKGIRRRRAIALLITPWTESHKKKLHKNKRFTSLQCSNRNLDLKKKKKKKKKSWTNTYKQFASSWNYTVQQT
jgi:hypothetical protein